ncbi:MAG: ABC transporter substrate-binding protein [Pseudomonadota bacterium]
MNPGNRRDFIACASALGALAIVGRANAQGRTDLRIQYDWLMDNGKLGDIVALHRGFFESEGLNVTFSPGGPNAQTVAPVLAGQAASGQMGSFQVINAFGEGLPVRMFASTYQQAPLAFVSLPRAPVRKPQDLVGKTIAVTPNGRWLLGLVLAINKIDPAKVKIVTAGAELTPLIVGQADVMTAFVTNTRALDVLGPDRILLSAEAAGLAYYTGTYFTAAESFDKQKDVLARFVRAVAKGWGWAYENRAAAVNLMCDAYPNMDRKVELATVDSIMSLVFTKETKQNGWGWIEPARLKRQIELAQQSGIAFRNPVTLTGVSSQEVLLLSAAGRPKLG